MSEMSWKLTLLPYAVLSVWCHPFALCRIVRGQYLLLFFCAPTSTVFCSYFKFKMNACLPWSRSTYLSGELAHVMMTCDKVFVLLWSVGCYSMVLSGVSCVAPFCCLHTTFLISLLVSVVVVVVSSIVAVVCCFFCLRSARFGVCVRS